jgi:hypothetical protein
MATLYDRMKAAWDSGTRHALDREAETLARQGVAEDDIYAALEQLLLAVRADGTDEETEERIHGVMDRLTGWTQPANQIRTTHSALPTEHEIAVDPYRVFISYAHADEPFVRQLGRVLKENGLQPVWDKDLAAGAGFDEQIKTFITHADAFLPVITPESTARGWVHQEIGFAMAHRVPILPVCRGASPSEFAMISRFQGIQCGDDIQEIRAQLWASLVRDLVQATEQEARPLFECAVFPDDRARMLAEYANRVRKMRQFGRVRQRGGFTSFNIPDRTIGHKDWKDRYGPLSRSDEHITLLRGERQALEKHAREAGCTLIISGGHYEPLGPTVRAVRIRTLIEFLEGMPKGKVRVAFARSDAPESVTIVGDWFYAQSVRATVEKGYQNTMFTRHALTVRQRAQDFDREFDELAQHPVNQKAATLAGAMEVLRDIMTRGPEAIQGGTGG